MKKKRKIRYDRILIVIIILGVIIFGTYKLLFSSNTDNNTKTEEKLLDMSGKKLTEANFYFDQNSIKVNIEYKNDDNIKKDYVISQDIKVGTDLKTITEITLVVSKGPLDLDKLKNDNINELGKIPIMMYHGIVNKKSSETSYIGGNVDKDGYNRTVEAFKKDLESYYNEGYRMIRLIDYVNGDINVEYGKSPIILTFDDGREDNIKVTGIDSNGEIIIDENSAVGILESFKKKYSDYNVTATFFLNSGLFEQTKYNDQILKWLVNNGYDIGNHTKNHVDFKKATTTKSEEEVGYMYSLLDGIIPNKYVPIIALPFGSPYARNHANFTHILNSYYNDNNYQTISTLRVGWDSELSPFNKEFDKTFLKRIRAYDNNGTDFDIEMNFRILKNDRYVSDGDPDIIVIKEDDKDKIINTKKQVIIIK